VVAELTVDSTFQEAISSLASNPTRGIGEVQVPSSPCLMPPLGGSGVPPAELLGPFDDESLPLADLGIDLRSDAKKGPV
jgi:hypothetical protein